MVYCYMLIAILAFIFSGVFTLFFFWQSSYQKFNVLEIGRSLPLGEHFPLLITYDIYFFSISSLQVLKL